MKALAKQNGSSYTVVLLAAVVLGAIGLVGYQMLSMNKKPNNNAAATAPPSSVAPQTLKTKDDIEHANSSLDNEKIDQNLNPDQLNQELDSIY